MKHKLLFLLTISFAILAVSCSPMERTNSDSSWNYTDLHLLSPYNETIAGGDFIAGYVRNAGGDLQLRFDLLEVNSTPQSDFYIALDTTPGGTNQLPIQGNADIEWETLLVLPADGTPMAYSAKAEGTQDFDAILSEQIREDLIPRISRIPWQDYILISINENLVPKTARGIQVQAFSTNPDSRSIKDVIGPFKSDTRPPQPAPIVLTFWNSFPAYSPAQSLRRWDGAHTGPYGERHGLSILLENVKKFAVPVVLLDLRNPFSLSALDYLDKLPSIRELASRKLVVLPDAVLGSPSYPVFPAGLPDWAVDQYLLTSLQVSQQFDLSPSQILYSPLQLDEFVGDYPLRIGPDDQKISASTNKYLPYPHQIPDEPQASPDGLPLAIRKLLIDIAIQINLDKGKYPLLILGGSLPDSSFGDPASSAATLSYIANHPWIKALSDTDLRSLPGNIDPQLLPGKTKTSPINDFSPGETLTNLPHPGENNQNPLINSIWMSALSLYAPLPPEPENLPSLRSNYSGQLGISHAAARWSENPQPRLDCQTDPDYDGIPECVIASARQFAVFDLEGGRLVAYYSISESGVHQIIAPSSQFIIGLGDPSTWLLDEGDGSDPSGIQGAFINSPPPWDTYNVSSNGKQTTFTSPDLKISKSFTLTDLGLQVDYSSSDPISVQIPIAIDPWRRFSPNWREEYRCQPTKNGYDCKLKDDSIVEFQSNSTISAYSFTDSYPQLHVSENPNLDYSPGHYMPFPMVILEIDAVETFSVQIKPSP
jgi:hypothetical protein